MELRQLRYFLAVVEEGLIVKAAERLNITQPPLSQQLKALEDELGTRLLIRNKKHIQLTESGRILERRARQMLEIEQRAEDEIQENTAGFRGSLSIGVIASYGSALLPQHLSLYQQRYPQVTFRLHQGSTQQIIDFMQAGLIELGFVRVPFPRDDFECLFLPEETIIVAASKERFPQSAASIEFSSLAGKPLLVHERHLPLITQNCHQNGFDPQIFCISDDIYPLLSWASEGLGIALVPNSAVHLTSDARLQFYSTNPTAITTTGAIIHDKKKPLTAAAQHLLELFQV